MLLGEEGLQKAELDRMVEWLVEEAKPDIIHLSNALLLGLVRSIKERLNVPVVCSLQDEDVWVDVMSDQHRQEVWDLMSERGREVDAFIPVSDYYAGYIRTKMESMKEHFTTVHIGVDPHDYSPVKIGTKKPVIGYISRMCEENGLAVLVDAYLLLMKNPLFAEVTLRITGGKTDDDLQFIKALKKKISVANLTDHVFWIEEFEGEERLNFYDTVRIISVPVLNGEAFGLYQLEAMASGIPMVQPALGAFPEVITSSGGGLIYTPNDAAHLSQALASLILDEEKLEPLSRAGVEGVRRHFDIHKQAKMMVEVYDEVLSNKKGQRI